MITTTDTTAHYCKRYAVFCVGANEHGECKTTTCWHGEWLQEVLKGSRR